MNRFAATVLPFALRDRWIVTVECERRLVNVRHRTRWYAVARRQGHGTRRHWCASHQDAMYVAEMMREAVLQQQAIESDCGFQQFRSWFEQQPDDKKEELRNSLLHPISN